MRKHRTLLLIAASLILATAGAVVNAGSAHAQGVCNTENAQSPNDGGGVIYAPHVRAGGCPSNFFYTVTPEAETGGQWYAWKCSGSASGFCQYTTGVTSAQNTIEVNSIPFDPTGGQAGENPSKLCAYRERILVSIYRSNGSFIDNYASSADPISC